MENVENNISQELTKPKTEGQIAVEQKIIHLMLKHGDVIDEMLDEGYSPEFFNSNHKRLVQAIYEEHVNSDHKRLLSRDSYRQVLMKANLQGDIFIHLTVYDKCMLQAHAAYDDLGQLKIAFRETYIAQKLDTSFQKFLKDVKKTGYYSATQGLIESIQDGLNLVETRRTVFAPLSELKQDFVIHIEEMRNNPKNLVTCGIPEIDDVVNVGFGPQQLTLFVGDVGNYKSSVMLSVGLGIAQNGYGVLFIPLEMSHRDLEKRIVSNKCGIDFNKLARPSKLIGETIIKNLSDEELQKIKDLDWALTNFYVLDAEERTSVSRLKREIEKRAMVFKPAVVIIDYIANLEPDVRFGSRNDLEIGEILKSLRFLGRKYGFHVISAAQMGRGAIKLLKEKGLDNSSATPDSTSIRGSHEYSADADTIFTLMKVPNEEDKLKIFALKARHGKSGQMQELQVVPELCRINSTANEWMGQPTDVQNFLSEPPKIETAEEKKDKPIEWQSMNLDDLSNMGLE